jgi:cytochrome c5
MASPRPPPMKFAYAVLLISAGLGCASLPRPTAADVTRAQTHFPQATLDSLEAGRRAFVDSCSGCHALPNPQKKRADQWPKVLDEMAGEAKLSTSQKNLIAQFLVTMSENVAASQKRGP